MHFGRKNPFAFPPKDCDSLHVDFHSILQIVCGVPQGSTFGPLLLLLYINDLANSSHLLSFRLIADDANIFYDTTTSKDLEAVMNSELQKVINYCNLKTLYINMRKTNFMIITSPQKPAILKQKHFKH